MTGGLLPPSQRGEVLTDYAMHITDWYPTVLAACGLDTLSINSLDGKNMWPIVSGDAFLTDIDSSEYSESESVDLDELGSNRDILLNVDSYQCESEICGSIILGGKWKLLIAGNAISNPDNSVSSCFWERNFQLESNSDVLGCNGIPDSVNTDTCNCVQKLCLFDLENDPCEYFDVSNEYDEIAQALYKKLAVYYNMQTEVLYREFDNVDDDLVNPENTDGFWEPFYDAEEYNIKNLEFEQLLKSYYTVGPNISPGNDEMDGINPVEAEEKEKEKKEKDQVLCLILSYFIVFIYVFCLFVCFE